MKPLHALGFLVLVQLGCAPRGEVKLRVGSALMARVPRDAPALTASRLLLVSAQDQLARAQQAHELARAGLQRGAPESAPTELQALHRAWLRAVVDWRAAGVETARAGVLAAQAATELAAAQLLERAGVDLDTAAFRAQVARLQADSSTAASEIARRHAVVDRCALSLAQAKERFAAQLRLEAARTPSPRPR
jgi:hypothetical protein